MLEQLSETPEDECAGHYVERIEGLYAHARETRSTHLLLWGVGLSRAGEAWP